MAVDPTAIMGPKNNIRILYDTMQSTGSVQNLGTFDQFFDRMRTPENRTALYNATKRRFQLGTPEEFEKRISDVIDSFGEAIPKQPKPFGPPLAAGNKITRSLTAGMLHSAGRFFNIIDTYAQALADITVPGGPTPIKAIGEPKDWGLVTFFEEGSKAIRTGGLDPRSIKGMTVEGLGQALVDLPLVSLMSLPGYSAFTSGGEALEAEKSLPLSAAEGFGHGLILHAILTKVGMLPAAARIPVGGVIFGGESLILEMMKPPEYRDLKKVIADFFIGAGLSVPGNKRPELPKIAAEKAEAELASYLHTTKFGRELEARAAEKRSAQETREGLHRLTEIENRLRPIEDARLRRFVDAERATAEEVYAEKATEIKTLEQAAKVLEGRAQQVFADLDVEAARRGGLGKGVSKRTRRIIEREERAREEVRAEERGKRIREDEAEARIISEAKGLLDPLEVEAYYSTQEAAELARVERTEARSVREAALAERVRKSAAGGVALRQQLRAEEQLAVAREYRRVAAAALKEGKTEVGLPESEGLSMPGDLGIIQRKYPDLVYSLFIGDKTSRRIVTEYFQKEGVISPGGANKRMSVVIADIARGINDYLVKSGVKEHLLPVEKVIPTEFLDMRDNYFKIFDKMLRAKISVEDAVREYSIRRGITDEVNIDNITNKVKTYLLKSGVSDLTDIRTKLIGEQSRRLTPVDDIAYRVRQSAVGGRALSMELTTKEYDAASDMWRKQVGKALNEFGQSGSRLKSTSSRDRDIIITLLTGGMSEREATIEYLKREGVIGEGALSNTETKLVDVASQYTFDTFRRYYKPARVRGSVMYDLSRGFTESVKALDELLGGLVTGEKGEVSIGGEKEAPHTFDEIAFRRAKPHMRRAAEAYKRAGRGVNEFTDNMISRYGEDIRPYIDKFLIEHDYDDPRAVEPYESIPEVEVASPIGDDVPVPETRLNMLEEHERTWLERSQDLLDVESRFIREGAPEMGFHFKNYFSVVSLHEEGGLRTGKDIVKAGRFSKFRPRDRSLIALLYESPKDFASLPVHERGRLQSSMDQLKSYFKEGQRLYAKEGVKLDFNKEILSQLQERFNTAKEGEKGKILKLMNEVETNLNFEHIPVSIWFSNKLHYDPGTAQRMLRVLAARKRRTIKIQDLIDAGLIKASDVDVVDIVSSYGRRMGKDLGLLRIINAGKKEGHAITIKDWNKLSAEEKKVYVTPHYTAPILKGYKVTKFMYDRLYELTSFNQGMGIIEKGITAAKMAKFINPLIMPSFDVVQYIHATGIEGVFKADKMFSKAYKDVRDRSANYVEAVDNGILSKPFNFPFGTWESMRDAAKRSGGEKITSAIDNMFKTKWHLPTGAVMLPARVIKHIYRASWNTAWTLDPIVRMSTYNFFRSKGFSARDTAQMTATFHADYASVPPRTRRVLNHALFTPTFAITMGKVQLKMIETALNPKNYKKRVVRDSEGKVVAHKIPIFDARTVEGRYARGLLTTIGILFGTDAIMRMLGFEVVHFGYSYKRKVDTEEGEEDLNITWPNPGNKVLRYIYRAQDSFGTSEEGSSVVRLLHRNKWEFTPAFVLFWNTFVENRNSDGEPIVDEFDDAPTKALRRSINAAREGIPLLKTLDFTKPKDKAVIAFQKEYSRALEIMMRPLTHMHLADPEKRKAVHKQQRLQEALSKSINDGTIRPEHFEEYIRRSEELLDVFDDFQ